MGACAQIAVFTYAVMRRTPAAGILEYIIPLLYLPVFTIWVSATKQASHTLKLSIVWVSATKQASHTHKLFKLLPIWWTFLFLYIPILNGKTNKWTPILFL